MHQGISGTFFYMILLTLCNLLNLPNFRIYLLIVKHDLIQQTSELAELQFEEQKKNFAGFIQISIFHVRNIIVKLTYWSISKYWYLTSGNCWIFLMVFINMDQSYTWYAEFNWNFVIRMVFLAYQNTLNLFSLMCRL